MINARQFALSSEIRRALLWEAKTQDHPVMVQFAANDPEILLQAARLVEKDCVAIDINLGCPQHIAKRGHYGAFLMEDWKLVSDMGKGTL